MVGILPVPKKSALESSRRELSEDVPFGIGTGTLLGAEQSSLENRQRGGGVMYAAADRIEVMLEFVPVCTIYSTSLLPLRQSSLGSLALKCYLALLQLNSCVRYVPNRLLPSYPPLLQLPTARI